LKREVASGLQAQHYGIQMQFTDAWFIDAINDADITKALNCDSNCQWFAGMTH